jgi:dTDP-glucose 4,6-dehydratase
VRTVLVTGGAGFIGSHFVEHLFDARPDDKIVVLDVFSYAARPTNIPARIRTSQRFHLVMGDIRDAALVKDLVAAADAVVHFAAESHVTRSIVDDTPFFEVDVMGTQTIASAISRNKDRISKFVHISTSEVYGTAAAPLMDENHPLNPCTPYAAAKAGADRLVYAYRETYGIPTVILRPFNNYGPRQHLEKVVPRFITAALRGEPLTVHGSGDMTRDWLFVTDTCKAVMAALENPAATGQVFNLGTGKDTSVLDIAEAICSAAGASRSLIRHVNPRPGQVDKHISDSRRAAQALGWEPTVDLLDGLRRTVAWYKANPSWWQDNRASAPVEITDAARGLSGSF